jgi:arsenite-transporting ATPase
LYAREIDAGAAFETERQRYHDAIDEIFGAMMPNSQMDASYDRVVMEDLIDLAPSGIDEVFAIVRLVDALEPDEARKAWDAIVIDTAPTGHTLRLLAMPRIAREWAHALLGILLKYRRILGLGELASDVLTFARKLRALEGLLRDESCTSFVAVTRPAELPRRETERLLARLARMRVPCPAVVVDAMTAGTCLRCQQAKARESVELRALARFALRARSSATRARAILVAPAMYPPPHGAAALARWAEQWQQSGPWKFAPSRAK